MATFAMLGATAISTGLNIAGALKQGDAAQAAAEANAQASESYARQTREEYAQKVDMEHFKNKLALGGIRAAYGASGVTMDGTPQEYMEQSAAVAKTNELNLRYEGIRKAGAYLIEARKYRQGGQAAQSAAGFNAIAAGFSGVSSAVGQIYGASQQRASLYTNSSLYA
jgi:hypothetical protein